MNGQPIYINFLGKITLNKLNELNNLKYKRYYLITYNVDDSVLKRKNKNIIIYTINNKNELKYIIDEVLEKEKNNYVLPFFSGDSNAKYSIRVIKKQNNSDIPLSLFKDKKKMNSFVSKINKKNNIKLNKNEIINTSYDYIKDNISEKVVIKPINGASSVQTFKVHSEDDFENVKKNLKSKYQYLIEEFIDGKLYALDFYFNGKDVFILSYTREIPFIELLEDVNNFSEEFLNNYGKEISNNFLYFIPIRYSLNEYKISSTELDFLNNLKDELKNINYHGFIHLEYKYDKKNESIGFIEWGARMGQNRPSFVKNIHNNIYLDNLPYYLSYKKDYGNFEKRNGIWYFKEKNNDVNIIGINTNFIEKTKFIDIMKKNPNYLSISFKDFFENYLYKIFGIETEVLKINSKNINGYYYPFYETSKSKLFFLLKLNNKNFKKFKEKKYNILEQIAFNSFK